jgi:hypothetical protein
MVYILLKIKANDKDHCGGCERATKNKEEIWTCNTFGRKLQISKWDKRKRRIRCKDCIMAEKLADRKLKKKE